jgi:uncharacterized membrane protein YjjB (DUF3815 family)
MVVPGPHLINGLLDLIDNYLPMSVSRLGLATGILLASALGIVLGIELILPASFLPERGVAADRLNLVSDVVLAGIVTCGFAVYYNTAWHQLWRAAVGGMAGNGLRFLALEEECWLEAATFLGGVTVGVVSAWMARSSKAPFAVFAFAGAVTMIPGLSLYGALGGALQLARQVDQTDAGTGAATLGHAFQGCLVVSALAIGLILGARAVLALAGQRDSPMGSRIGHEFDEAARRIAVEPVDHPVSTSSLTDTGGSKQ